MVGMEKSPAKTQKSNSTRNNSKGLTKNLKSHADKHRTVYFSIVIPTLNEEKYLPLLLQDLTDQSFDKSMFEVIHVDGSSDDSTVQVAKSFKTELKLVTHICPVRNVATQRNLGGKHASGKWVVFMDADDRIPPYFLDGLKYQLEKNNADVYTCWQDTQQGSSSERALARATNLGFSLVKQVGIPAVAGAMIISRKTVLKTVSFPIKNQLAEDTIFMDTAIKRGYKYQILREPRYLFSVRRYKKEGALKMMVIEAKMAINYLFGDKFVSSNQGYVMEGGKYYESSSEGMLIHSLRTYLEKATRKQKEAARKILEQIDNAW